jgi:hypothetical protein
MDALAPEKPPGLAGRNFCLAILLNHCEGITNGMCTAIVLMGIFGYPLHSNC